MAAFGPFSFLLRVFGKHYCERQPLPKQCLAHTGTWFLRGGRYVVRTEFANRIFIILKMAKTQNNSFWVPTRPCIKVDACPNVVL